MRIISGRFKGTVLTTVGKGDARAHLRPTTDRVRESIFNLLINGAYGDPISNVSVLDLFAGTGALGFEALSRGASFVQFVDDGRKASALIVQNAKTLRVQSEVELVQLDALKLGFWKKEPFALVFLDPPYGKEMGQLALSAALAGGWLAEDALIVWEENQKQSCPVGFTMLDARRYGETWVHILEVVAA
ncbi:MAG: 16S rRNA (guanine(966)-N(2))-methyltransferase RsmD [Rhodobacteraceae bacterium]|nr:16S rRNA (guanine(966)-N(2))-methyltransferase RsmD [Paracoccaceae bacterium]